MKTLDQIKEVLKQVAYKDGWNVEVHIEDNKLYLQVVFDGADAVTGVVEKQKCRKWLLSYHMTNTELVCTAFKAILAAEEHETRELFRYKDVRVFNPHFSVEDIVDMVKANQLTEQSRLLEYKQ